MAKLNFALLSLLAIGASALPSQPLAQRQCGTILAPYDIITVNSQNPDAPGIKSASYVTEYQNSDRTSKTKTLLRFNIPPSASQKMCTLVMNFPDALFKNVYLTKFDEYTPVYATIYKVEQSPALPALPSYNQIVRSNGPWGAWALREIKAGKQILNAERCDQVQDFLLQVPEFFNGQMGASWAQNILESANDGDNSFGIYLRYGDGC